MSKVIKSKVVYFLMAFVALSSHLLSASAPMTVTINPNLVLKVTSTDKLQLFSLWTGYASGQHSTIGLSPEQNQLVREQINMNRTVIFSINVSAQPNGEYFVQVSAVARAANAGTLRLFEVGQLVTAYQPVKGQSISTTNNSPNSAIMMVRLNGTDIAKSIGQANTSFYVIPS